MEVPIIHQAGGEDSQRLVCATSRILLLNSNKNCMTKPLGDAHDTMG